MKNINLIISVVVAAGIILGSTGCKSTKKQPTVTQLPSGAGTGGTGTAGTGTGTGIETTTPITQPPQPGSEGLKPPQNPGDLPDPDGLKNMTPDREFFKAQTVYFDFDSSAIKTAEKSKIDFVANFLKGNADTKIQVEGHCDERGTEEYNRALGEKRALAIREYLINAGISGSRVYTISFGEDKPADPGHNESAWAKNRRGEFILYRPKK
ncbi:MAG: peptidoglycan-associated lipoprotein Pal [Verrucomicrobiae bacterium]|nr:peptidoglycan-associated lipoprotein Pal [Verrucomicrobiae bacterium]